MRGGVAADHPAVPRRQDTCPYRPCPGKDGWAEVAVPPTLRPPSPLCGSPASQITDQTCSDTHTHVMSADQQPVWRPHKAREVQPRPATSSGGCVREVGKAHVPPASRPWQPAEQCWSPRRPSELVTRDVRQMPCTRRPRSHGLPQPPRHGRRPWSRRHRGGPCCGRWATSAPLAAAVAHGDGAKVWAEGGAWLSEAIPPAPLPSDTPARAGRRPRTSLRARRAPRAG